MSYLNNELAKFPSPEYALTDPNGLLAIGGDLHPKRLLSAYYDGIFPWFNENDPILWWSPDPRAVFVPGTMKISRSLKRHINKSQWRFSVNRAFNRVIESCAQSRQGKEGTWITAEIQHAYKALHRQGKAHSIEVWENEQLVGGLYGIAVGQVFCGESMFHYKTNASKAAMMMLHQHLLNHKFRLIDAQVMNPHLESLGAKALKRSDFINLLKRFRDIEVASDTWHCNEVFLEL
nr:leucyl/phenylalanyl-tRNA--protein transferase [Shewanella sp. Isolate11]